MLDVSFLPTVNEVSWLRFGELIGNSLLLGVMAVLTLLPVVLAYESYKGIKKVWHQNPDKPHCKTTITFNNASSDGLIAMECKCGSCPQRLARMFGTASPVPTTNSEGLV